MIFSLQEAALRNLPIKIIDHLPVIKVNQFAVLGHQNLLVFQVDHPTGLETEEDLTRILSYPVDEALIVLLERRQLVTVFLGQFQALLGDLLRIGQVTARLRVRVVLELVQRWQLPLRNRFTCGNGNGEG